MQFPKRRLSDALKIRDDGPIYLTPEGIKRLKEKLIRLKQELPDLIAEAKRTAAYGDRSDNAEYKEAKSILRRTHRQILGTEDQLKRAIEITLGRNATGTIKLGSTVILESKERVRKTFQIVGPYETNPERGRISHQSPLGAALIDHTKGEKITIQTMNGPKEFLVIEVH
ncbi:MAG: GreA/GreB family elongation factor [Candidatus Harrisonbacteria bacterium]|nr:GreA/GreB family elongation factor [Candidatus Harrisonbacteria bacterium]